MGPYECVSAGRSNHLRFALHAFNVWNCECDILYRCSNAQRARLFTHEQCAIDLQRKEKQNKTSNEKTVYSMLNAYWRWRWGEREREKKKVAWNHSYFEHMSPIWHGHIHINDGYEWVSALNAFVKYGAHFIMNA